MDGIPHELWKKLVEQHDDDERQGRQSFDVIEVLTALYNDIEEQGMTVGTNFSVVKLMIDMCEVEETNGAIVCLDQEKAYNKIAHDFLFRSLARFGLPEHFINTVRSLYGDAHTVVIINGEISSPFQITHGVRQGNPLSCLLFNVAIESLATMLRESNSKVSILRELSNGTLQLFLLMIQRCTSLRMINSLTCKTFCRSGAVHQKQSLTCRKLRLSQWGPAHTEQELWQAGG